MTKCFTLNGQIINVGPWDYCVVDEKRTVLVKNEAGEVIDQYDEVTASAVTNPLPEGAIEEDLALAWSAAGRVVRADDAQAAAPYEGKS